MKTNDYEYIIVESYYPVNTSGLHGPVHIRPLPNQEPFLTTMSIQKPYPKIIQLGLDLE